jgi:hypothetical protein
VSDRRRDRRFKLAEPADASLTVFPDIVVQEARDGEWIAISREPATIGETLVLDIVLHADDDGEVRERFDVCVIDSQPLVVEGDLRHRLRLFGNYDARILFEQQVRRG